MINSVTQAEHDRLINALSYAIGQLRSVHMDHRIHMEYKGIAQLLRRGELHRGFEDGRDWLRDLEERAQEDLPEWQARRGARAREAVRLGGRARENRKMTG